MSRDLLLVAISLSIWGIGEGAFFFFQPLSLQQFGADPVVIGGILSAVGISMTFTHLPAGFLSDRFGRRPVLFLSWILGTIAAWIMALAKSLPIFSAGLILYGVTAFVVSPLNSYITAARGKWSVGRAITVISATYNAGAIIGPTLGGYVSQHLGLSKVYLIASIAFSISTVIIFFIKPQPVETTPPDSKNHIFSNRYYPVYMLMFFIATFAMYLPQPLSSIFLQNQHQLSFSSIGFLGSINSAGIVLLNLVLGRINLINGFIISQAAVAGFTIFLWHGKQLPAFAIGYIFLGGYRAARSLSTAITRTLTVPLRIGAAYGIFETINGIAVILAPYFAGLLYNQSPKSMYIVSFYGLCLSMIGTYIATNYIQKRTANQNIDAQVL